MNSLAPLLLVIFAGTNWAQTSISPKRLEADTTLRRTHNIIEYRCPWCGLSLSENRIGGRARFLLKAQSA